MIDTGITELSIAKQIQSGELSSPQQYENIWLFDVRVTGTGTSYRTALEEYVYRPPENFLTEDFLERCNGLPLIYEHPDKTILSTDEYRDRAIGIVILPYIKSDEVWGIAKVYDNDAALLMSTSHISTSPSVVFRDAGSTETILLDDGKSVLIEGKPSYLDHLAICEAGVWDKGGEPTGINLGGNTMAAEENIPAWADALVKRMDSMEAADKARKDSEEKMKADAEEEAKKKADSEEEAKLKADAAESEEDKAKREKEAKADAEADKNREEEKADSAKVIAGMAAEIAALNAKLAPLSHADRDLLSAAQARADSVAQMFGDSAHAPLFGESPIAYRKRLAEKFKAHSASFKDVKLDSLDGPAFDVIESKIYADAQAAAISPSSGTAGRLMPIVTRENGREITRYTGDSSVWMAPFQSPAVGIAINNKGA